MKTFVIISDTHGRSGRELAQLSPLFAENDFVVHLGDGSSDLKEFSRQSPQKVYLCKGNCDLTCGEAEYVIEAEGVSVLCCHGHKYGVKSGLSRLVARAKELGCSAALYGHTHRAEIQEQDGVLCINPGALSSFSNPSYCYLVLYRGKAIPTIVPLRE